MGDSEYQEIMIAHIKTIDGRLNSLDAAMTKVIENQQAVIKIQSDIGYIISQFKENSKYFDEVFERLRAVETKPAQCQTSCANKERVDKLEVKADIFLKCKTKLDAACKQIDLLRDNQKWLARAIAVAVMGAALSFLGSAALLWFKFSLGAG